MTPEELETLREALESNKRKGFTSELAEKAARKAVEARDDE